MASLEKLEECGEYCKEEWLNGSQAEEFTSSLAHHHQTAGEPTQDRSSRHVVALVERSNRWEMMTSELLMVFLRKNRSKTRNLRQSPAPVETPEPVVWWSGPSDQDRPENLLEQSSCQLSFWDQTITSIYIDVLMWGPPVSQNQNIVFIQSKSFTKQKNLQQWKLSHLCRAFLANQAIFT